MTQLSPEEMEKFARWCEEQAHADDGLLLQMDRIQAPKALQNQYRAAAAALRVVAARLRGTEAQNVGGDA